MRKLGLLLLGLVFVLSACTSTSNNSSRGLNPTQKGWKNYQTQQRGYGIYYPGYNNAPKKNTKPSWANRPYNQPPRPVRPMPSRR